MTDDDCTGSCDEAGIAGCRVGVHRSSGSGHLYTTSLSDAGATPFNIEAADYFFLYAQEVPGGQPLFLCRKGNGKYLLTTDTQCETAAYVAQLGFLTPLVVCGSRTLYRLHHAPTDNHFYTLNAAERDNAINNLGYVSEASPGYVW